MFPDYPRGVWIAGIIGSLAGMVLLDTGLQGIALGLACMVIYNALHGLLTGKITWVGDYKRITRSARNEDLGDGQHNGQRIRITYHTNSTRKDDPGGYWLAVIMYLLLGGWILKGLGII